MIPRPQGSIVIFFTQGAKEQRRKDFISPFLSLIVFTTIAGS